MRRRRKTKILATLGPASNTLPKMRELFDALSERHTGIDTVSMGMSDDFVMAIEQGATLVRVGSSLFGPRPASYQDSNLHD